MAGILRACEKRPVSVEEVEVFVAELEQRLQEQGEREIQSSALGERVMEYLHELDDVAYVRFASVYRSFKDLKEFMAELKELIQEEGKHKKNKRSDGTS